MTDTETALADYIVQVLQPQLDAGSVTVEQATLKGQPYLLVLVAADQMPFAIGRRGRTADALRTLVHGYARRLGCDGVNIQIRAAP